MRQKKFLKKENSHERCIKVLPSIWRSYSGGLETGEIATLATGRNNNEMGGLALFGPDDGGEFLWMPKKYTQS